MTNLPHIVVVDDDPDILNLLKMFFRRENYSATYFATATAALEAFVADPHYPASLIITDWKMPEMDGIEFVTRIKKVRPDLPIILTTAYGSIEGAIEAIREGAYDYIVKPLRWGELKTTIDRAVKFRKLEQDNDLLRQQAKRSWISGKMIGKSQEMRGVFDLIRRVAPTTASVLIRGESGTGKEMVAQAIHHDGPRALKPFVAINCTAIPESLLESELFGHSKGSFTGALQNRRGLFSEADGGSIFLDEIGDMPGALQVKLLRVIQERKIKPVGENTYREIDVRIMAATHKDLRAEVRSGRFREDLYYRLNVIPITIPPLRERSEDIPLLADHFLRKCAAAHGSHVMGFTPAAIKLMIGLPWEGNVRELENVIERAVTLCDRTLIDHDDISPPCDGVDSGVFLTELSISPVSLREVERRYIQLILEKTGGEKKEAARILGIDRKTLYRKGL